MNSVPRSALAEASASGTGIWPVKLWPGSSRGVLATYGVGPGEALHISNGDAADVPAPGLARRVVYWRDVLHEGPVPEAAPAELRRIRAGYLTGEVQLA
jgi:hypothetical protein